MLSVICNIRVRCAVVYLRCLCAVCVVCAVCAVLCAVYAVCAVCAVLCAVCVVCAQIKSTSTAPMIEMYDLGRDLKTVRFQLV